MLNAKQFDKLFGKTQIVWQILTLFGKHLFCLANIIFVWQTFFVWQIHCFRLANTILFGKIIEPIKQFGIQHDLVKQFVKLFELFSGSVGVQRCRTDTAIVCWIRTQFVDVE